VRLILLGLQDRLMPIIDPTERERDRSVRRTSHGLPPCEARWVLRRLEFHHVPKHASWLNMVEIEIGVLRSQRLDRRIAVKRASLFGKIVPWVFSRCAPRALRSGAARKRGLVFTTRNLKSTT